MDNKGLMRTKMKHTITQVLGFVKKKSSCKDCNKSTHFRDNLGWILPIPVLIRKNLSSTISKFKFNPQTC